MEYKVTARGHTRRRKLRFGRKMQTANAYRENAGELLKEMEEYQAKKAKTGSSSSSSLSATAAPEQLEAESDNDYDSGVELEDAQQRAAFIDSVLQANNEEYADRSVKRQGGFDMVNVASSSVTATEK